MKKKQSNQKMSGDVMEMEAPLTVELKGDRKKLGEGRTYGIGFALCKNLGNNKFETVLPISACKDYLNDVIFSEATGKSITAHGLSYSKKGIFEGQDFAYAVMSMLDNNHGSSSKYQDDVKTLEANYENLNTFINFFEEKFGVETLTKFEKIGDNLYFSPISKYWVDATYKISLWGLLLRSALNYDGTITPWEFVKSGKSTTDSYLLNSIVPKIEKLMSGFVPKIYFPEGGYQVHNCGIVGYKFE
jgi:hypothetical protein